MISSFYTVTSVSRSADRTLIRALLRSSIIRFPIIVHCIDPNARTRVFHAACRLHFALRNVILGRESEKFSKRALRNSRRSPSQWFQSRGAISLAFSKIKLHSHCCCPWGEVRRRWRLTSIKFLLCLKYFFSFLHLVRHLLVTYSYNCDSICQLFNGIVACPLWLSLCLLFISSLISILAKDCAVEVIAGTLNWQHCN